MGILDLLRSPWPWYVAGPLIGLTVPALLLLGNKSFGISENLRHLCALVPNRMPFFRYDVRGRGAWNLAFAVGIVVGGFVAAVPLADREPLQVAPATVDALARLSITVDGGMAPEALFGVTALSSWGTWIFLLVGGFLIGFGARYAGGCTSGHAISGLSALQLPSLVAVAGFFAGGLISTYLLLPWIFGR